MIPDIHVGTIVECTFFSKARQPAFQLVIDFGHLGMRQSSAQITQHYSPETLVGTQVICMTGLAPKLIAGFTSECLVLAATDPVRGTILLKPEQTVANGTRIA